MQTNQNSNKRLFINLSANIVSYSANILIAFVLTPFLINTLGKETYSFYPIANNFVAYMCILTNALNSMSSRFVTVAIVKGQIEDSKKYVSSILFSNMIMGAILLIPMVAIVVFLDCIMNVPVNIVASIRILFSLVFASMLVNIVSSVFGVATFVKNRIDLRSAMQLVSGLLKIVLFYTLFKFFTPTIVYVGVVALAVAISESLFQQHYFKRLLPEINISPRYFSQKHIKTILASGSWNSVNAIGSLLLTSSSLIMANIIYGAASGGIYSIVNTVPIFINGVISMLVGVFAPTVTYSYAKENKAELLHDMEKAQSMIGFFSCSVLVVFLCLSRQFFMLWTPAEDAEQLFRLSAITVIPHFFIGCLWSITNLNIAANKVAKPAILQLILGILNVLIVVALSQIWDTSLVTICVVCTSLTLVLVLFFLPLYAASYLNVSWLTFYKVVFRMLIGTTILIALFSVTTMPLHLDSWFSIMSVGVLMGIVALAVNFLFMFNKQMKHNMIIKLKNKIQR